MCQYKLIYIIYVLIMSNPVFTGYSWKQLEQERKNYNTPSTSTMSFTETSPQPPPLLPQFDLNQNSHVTVLEGQSAQLPCVVHNLGDRVVSWIRMQDLHILTSDVHQYTSDTRFEISHRSNSDEWHLIVDSTRPSDTGYYECQVNTDPKIKFPVILTVIDSDPLHDAPTGEQWNQPNTDTNVKNNQRPIARITGPFNQYIRPGSTVTFQCEVSGEQRQKSTSTHNTHINGVHSTNSYQENYSAVSSNNKTKTIKRQEIDDDQQELDTFGSTTTQTVRNSADIVYSSPPSLRLRAGAMAGIFPSFQTSSSSTRINSNETMSAKLFLYPRITHAPIIWTHQGRLVTFQAARGGISLDTDYRDTVSISRLTIAKVQVADDGDYVCSQGDSIPATVRLRVSNHDPVADSVNNDHPYHFGDHAMQRDMAIVAASSSNSLQNSAKIHRYNLYQLLSIIIIVVLIIKE